MRLNSSARWSPKKTMLLKQKSAVASLLLSLQFFNGCAALRPQTPAEQALNSAELLQQARRQSKSDQHDAVLATVERAKGSHALTPDLRVLAIRALYLRNSIPLAQAAERELLSLPADALRDAALGQIARFHLDPRKQPADAWRVLQPTLAQGCGNRALCAIARDVLVALALADQPIGLQAVQAAPTASEGSATKPSRFNWFKDVATALVRVDRLRAIDAMYQTELAKAPNDVQLWLQSYLFLKRGDPDSRAAWLDRCKASTLSAALLLRIAQALEPADRNAIRELLATATQRKDADERIWIHYLNWLGRAADKKALIELARGLATKPPSPLLSAVLARNLLVSGALAQAEELVRPLLADATDAVALALQAEIHRQRYELDKSQRAEMEKATQTAQQAVKLAKDRSEIQLLLAQLWRHARVIDALGFLREAAKQPGRGQLPAARELCQRALQLHQTADAKTCVDYARLLTATQQPEPSAFYDAFEPMLPNGRRELIKDIAAAGAPWAEIVVTSLRIFSDAGVAEPPMLRELAVRALQQADDEGFLQLDARAVQQADAQHDVLDTESVVAALTGRGGTILARWLRQNDDRLLGDTWSVAFALMTGRFAMLGRRWALRALQEGPPQRLNTGKIDLLTSGGAADVALELLHNRPPVGPIVEDVDFLKAELRALLALDRADEAHARLLDTSKRPDMNAQLQRVLLDAAWDLGLCKVVAEIAPRLVGERDTLAWQRAIARGVDCAHRQQQTAIVDAIGPILVGTKDAARLDFFAKQLTINGFEAQALPIFQSLDPVRPSPPDTLLVWARAMLVLQRPADADILLRRFVQTLQNRPEAWNIAGELMDDYGHIARAQTLYERGLTFDPDNLKMRTHQIVALMRQNRTDNLPEALLAFFKSGPAAVDLTALLEVAESANLLGILADAAAALPDADRELERFRVELAAHIGSRPQVQAGVRRLRARGPVQSARVPLWLHEVGAIREAREVVEDILASPEPLGARQERPSALAVALDLRRDATSVPEAMRLVRLYLGRALEATFASRLAASELTRRGMSKQAKAVAATANSAGASPTKLCLQAGFEWDGGNAALAKELWHRAMAGILLDPRLRERLKSDRGWRRTNDVSWGPDDDDMHEIDWQIESIILGLTESDDLATLGGWFEELLEIAPESTKLRAAIIELHLDRGRLSAAVAGLRDAAQVLPVMEQRDFDYVSQRIIQMGGAPQLLQWLAQEGENLRAEPWFVAFLQHVVLVGGATAEIRKVALADGQESPMPTVRTQDAVAAPTAEQLAVLQNLLDTLPKYLPSVRHALAQLWSGGGNGEKAAQLLGKNPFTVSDMGQMASAVQAVTSTLVALQQPQPKRPGLETANQSGARPWLTRWFEASRSFELATIVASECVRQGQPQLAQWMSEVEGRIDLSTAHLGYATTAARTRFFAALGAADDVEVIATAQVYLRTMQDDLKSAQEVVTLMLRAGRLDAARKWLALRKNLDPQMQMHDLLDPLDAPTTEFARLVQQFRPEALELMRKGPRDVGHALALQAQSLAAAADPQLAEQWTAALAVHDDEAWRVWLSLLEAANDWEQADLARLALMRAQAAGAPVGMLACDELWLNTKGGFADCLRDRPIDALPETDLAALAAAVAQGLDTAGQTVLVAQLTSVPMPIVRRFLSAAASRLWFVGAIGQQKLQIFSRNLHASMLQVRQRDAMTFLALDELAEIGVGDLGIDASKLTFEHDPIGRSQRNNLAYARFLAGDNPQQVLDFVVNEQYHSGGEMAFAVLDTIAALLWATGQQQAAVAMQRRALTSEIVPSVVDGNKATSRRLQGPMTMANVRLAEFSLAMGKFDDARVLAAVVLTKPDHIATAQRARKVIKATLTRALSKTTQ